MNNETLPSLIRSGCACEKSANFDFRPKKKGKKFRIYKGNMYSSCTDIERAAVKVDTSRQGSMEVLEKYVLQSQNAHGIARKFSKMCNVTVSFPELHLAVMDKVSVITNTMSRHRKLSSDEFVLFEPFIRGSLEYFVTCDGIVTENCPKIIEELCHFSYHDSNGTNILRGLKGVWRKDGCTFQLASPATEMFSKGSSCGSENRMAVTNFFDNHHCTHRCEKWLSCQSQSCLNDISYMIKNLPPLGPPPPYE